MIENADSDAEVLPSLTEMVMFEKTPAALFVGLPLSLPVAVLKLAHEGLLTTENVRVSPSGSDAEGVNE